MIVGASKMMVWFKKYSFITGGEIKFIHGKEPELFGMVGIIQQGLTFTK